MPNEIRPWPLSPGLARQLQAASAQPLYVVGGVVRDALLGRAPFDCDLVAYEPVRLVAQRIARLTGGGVFALSADHGAWRVMLPDGYSPIRHVDVTQVRGTLAHDLGLRDFTINAIVTDLHGTVVADTTGGVADLHAGRLRLVREEAIAADPIRALRAVRLACELGAAIDAESARVITRDHQLIRRVAGERVRDEVLKTLDTSRAADGVRLCDALQLLDIIMPELAAARGCEQPPEHYWDVLTHAIETVAVLDRVLLPAAADQRVALLWQAWAAADVTDERWRRPLGEGYSRGAILKLAALLHDVSKPETRSVMEDGRIRFFGHPERGAVVATGIAERLRLSARESAYISRLIREHLRPGQLAPVGEWPSLRALYRLYRELGDDVSDLLLLHLADGAAAAGPRQTDGQWAAHVRYTQWLLQQPRERETLVARRRLINGADLITEFGLAPGPLIGRLLDLLAEAEATGEITSREQAMDLARTHLSP